MNKTKPKTKLLVSRLKELRLARGLTQQQMGESLNTEPPVISKMENGLIGIGPTWIDRFSTYFNIEPWELFVSKEEVGKEFFNKDLLSDCISSVITFAQKNPAKISNDGDFLASLIIKIYQAFAEEKADKVNSEIINSLISFSLNKEE